jgi:hypothetical protein
MSGIYDPEWIHSLHTVTPDDIHKSIAGAIAAGGDPEELNAWLQQAIKDAGGTIDKLARAWTFKNRIAAYARTLHRTRRVGGSAPS